MNYSIALVQLPLVSEAGEEQITTPTEAHRACSDMAVLAQECFHVLCLDTRNRLINRHMVSLGAADSCPASPRDVFRPTISDGATAIVIVHNHPSGDATPSSDDLIITRQIIDAGKILNVKVLDHIIIGRATKGDGNKPLRPPFLSLRESGLCTF